MKQVWQSVDGRVFKSEEQCREYELTISKQVTMFDRDGDPTNDPDNAMIVRLVGDKAASIFINMCGEKWASEGITEEDTGWFFWSEYGDRYIYIDQDMVKAFAKVFGLKN